MVELSDRSKLVGGDLPNIYIDLININNKSVDLDISFYEDQSSIRFIATKRSVAFRFFQITDTATFNIYKNLNVVQLLKLVEEDTVKILDVNFNDIKKIKQFVRSDGLIRKSQTITFEQPKNIDNLYYIATAYFQETQQAFLYYNNSRVFTNKAVETVIQNKILNKTKQQYFIPRNNTIWNGEVRLINGKYYTRDLTFFSTNNVLLEVREIENEKIKDLRDIEKPLSQKQQVSIEIAPNNVKPLQMMNNSFAKQNFINFVKTEPVLKPELNIKTENVVFPSITRKQPNTEPNLELIRTKAYQESVKINEVGNKFNLNFTINFTMNLKKVLFDSFLNKKYFNDSIYQFLKDSLIENKIKLFKKLVPNKETGISAIKRNQQDIFCTDQYTFTDVVSNNKNESLRSYSITDNIKLFNDKNNYTYFVQLNYENKSATKIIEQLTFLKNNLSNILIYQAEFERNRNSPPLIKQRKYTNVLQVINKYIELYCIINDCSTQEKRQLEFKVFNLMSPNSASSKSISIFIKAYNDLYSQYSELYTDLTGKANINFQILDRTRKIPQISKYITIIKNIISQDLQSAQKIESGIYYLNNIVDGMMTLQDFVDRIKQEKQRFFITENTGLYSTENMFSYLSPEFFIINNELFELVNLEKNKKPKSFELFLNNSVTKMKQIEETNIDKFRITNVQKFDEDQALRTELYERTITRFSEKYNLQILENKIEKINGSEEKNKVEQYRQSKIIKKIEKLNSLIDFNNNFNIDIPDNLSGLPNHIIRAKEKGAKFNTYRDIFDYRTLVKLEFYNGKIWQLLTKSSILDFIKTSDRNLIRCRMTEYDYRFNKNLKYNISKKNIRKIGEFNIKIDTNVAEQLIQSV